MPKFWVRFPDRTRGTNSCYTYSLLLVLIYLWSCSLILISSFFPPCLGLFCLHICRFRETIPLSLLRNFISFLFFAPFHPYVSQLPYPLPFPPCALPIQVKILTGDLQWSGFISLLFYHPIDLFILFSFPLIPMLLRSVFWYLCIIRAYNVCIYPTCCTCIYLFSVSILYSMLVLLAIFY